MKENNYSLNSNSTTIDNFSNINETEDIKINISIPSLNTNKVEIDLSRYNSNKPIRKIIRGSIINE